MMIAFTESRTVTGKVTDINGQPLAGVTVSIKGTAISAFTGTWLSSYIFELIGLNGLYTIAVILLTVGIGISLIFRKTLSI